MKTSKSFITFALIGLLMSVSAYDATAPSCDVTVNPILDWLKTNFGATVVFDTPQDPPTGVANYPCKTTWTMQNKVCVNWTVLEPLWKAYIAKQAQRIQDMAKKIQEIIKEDGPLKKFLMLTSNVDMAITRCQNMPAGLREALPVNPTDPVRVSGARVLQTTTTPPPPPPAPISGTATTTQAGTGNLSSYTNTATVNPFNLPPPTNAPPTGTPVAPINYTAPQQFTGTNFPPRPPTACDPTQVASNCRSTAGAVADLRAMANIACTPTANEACPQLRPSADGTFMRPPCTGPNCPSNPNANAPGTNAPPAGAAEPATPRAAAVELMTKLRAEVDLAGIKAKAQKLRETGPKCFEHLTKGRNMQLCLMGSGMGHTKYDREAGAVAFPETTAGTIVKECIHMFRFNFAFALVENYLKIFKLAAAITANPAAANVPPPAPMTSYLPAAVISVNLRPRLAACNFSAAQYCGMTNCNVDAINCGHVVRPGCPMICPYPKCQRCGVKDDSTYADCATMSGPPVPTVTLNPPSVSAGPASQLKICQRVQDGTASPEDMNVAFMNFFQISSSSISEGSTTLAANVASSADGAPTSVRILQSSNTETNGPCTFSDSTVTAVSDSDSIAASATINLAEEQSSRTSAAGKLAVGLVMMALAVFAF